KTGKNIHPKDKVESILNEVEYITFLSSSTVEAFHESIEGDLSLLDSKKLVSIGPVTTKTMLELGYNVSLEAKVFDVDGVISVIGDEK
ncbi:MAG: uroporphyrinogen-III synthase, partial [Cetobacterium sp.]